MIRRTASFVVAATVLSCNAGSQMPPEAEPASRSEVLASLAREVMMPTIEELQASAVVLDTAAIEFCQTPSAVTLDSVRSAWRGTRGPLKRQEAFDFGPIEDERIDAAIDFWPAREDAAEVAIASGTTPTDAWIDAQGVAAKGLPVLEYLLFVPDDATVLAAVDISTTQGEHRCDYIVALAHDVARKTEGLNVAWSTNGGAFVNEVAEAGMGSTAYPSVQMALDEVVNREIFILQDITDAKLGKPLGNASGGEPQPKLVESRFADNACADIAANLFGARAIYEGADGGLGLAALLEPELDAAVRDAFDASQSAIDGLAVPIRTAITSEPATVEAARLEVRELRRLFEVDVANVLGVTVTLNDNDGD